MAHRSVNTILLATKPVFPQIRTPRSPQMEMSRTCSGPFSFFVGSKRGLSRNEPNRLQNQTRSLRISLYSPPSLTSLYSCSPHLKQRAMQDKISRHCNSHGRGDIEAVSSPVQIVNLQDHDLLKRLTVLALSCQN